MGSEAGLRERKKRQTYEAVSEAAIALFLERGFDKVSVAEVAAAAGVSKPTLFRYFPTKEDLVLHRFADHEDEAARVVAAGRAAGVAPLPALHANFRQGLDRRDPVTGLCDNPHVHAYYRLLYGTPSLVARLHAYQSRSQEALAAELGEGLGARLAAVQIIAVQRIIAEENWRRIAAGEGVEALYAEAVRAADQAFGQLGAGLGAEYGGGATG
ncbi:MULTISPECIES: TetR/AcrR family transcriptional regulator [unclassified Streptomyces]|uniref:TetR/AcrR family transcriptional regulator n=1 Tax=unclassified Streptomyces TaxID=2593676 RepID=UPI003806B079